MTDNHKKTGFIQLIAVIIFVILSFIVSSVLKIDEKTSVESTMGTAPISVTTQMVTPETHHVQFQVTGTVEARAEVNIVPQVSGKVISVNDNFYEGGAFKAGEILFEIDPVDFELQIRQLEAEVSKAQTALNLAQAESDAAKKEWRQVRGKKTVPDLVAKIPQLNEANATLNAAQAQLESAKLNLERTKFSMPFDGVVLSGNVAIGQFISAGQTYGTVYDENAIEVKSSLSEQQLNWLEKSADKTVKMTHKSMHGTLVTQGYVKRIASTLNPNTRFATVAFGIQNAPENLMSGQLMIIDTTGPAYNNISIIPVGAYQKDGLVYMVNADKLLQSFEPDILYSTNDYIAVQNLNEATEIVTSKLSGAAKNTPVKIIEPVKEQATE